MTDIAAFLSDLKALNIKVWAEEDALRCKAPKGALTPQLQLELKKNKVEILKHLQDNSFDVIQAIPRTQALPISYAQQRLWFLNQLEGPSATYNVPVAFRLEGPLQFAALEQSWREQVQRHEILRAVFPSINGQPVVKLLSINQYNLSTINLQNLLGQEQNKAIKQLVNEEAHRPFDLSKGPLFRTTILQLGAESYLFLLTLHHIVSDGWSIGILCRELSILYEAFCEGQASPLSPLPIQYADFAHWQRQWLSGERLDKQIAYWKQQLNGAPALLELPTDHLRPPRQSFRGGVVKWTLSAELTHSLKQLSLQTEGTLFITLLSAFAVLLHRYTGQTDVVIGYPIANRTKAQIESLIGFFVNTLVLRSDLSGNPSFEALLGQIKQRTLEASVHQDIPFEKLIEELQPNRTTSYSPLFQVMFVLQNASMDNLALSGLTVTSFVPDSIIAKFDLTLFMEETIHGLTGTFEYNTDLFECATIQRMRDHFQTLLAGIVEHPQQQISTLPLLTQAEQTQFQAWNDTATDYPQDKCIHQLFESQVEQTPEAIAVVFENQQITYQELNCKANQVAHYLQTLGVKPEVLVGICIERSIEMVIGLLSILKAGGAYLPLDPTYPATRLAFMLTDSPVPVLLTQSSLVDQLPSHQAQVVCLDTSINLFSPLSVANPVSALSPSNLAYVIYTSGSTGTPKGAMNTHKGICNRLLWMQEAYQLTTADSVLQKTPFSFDVSVWEFFWPLLVGARLVVAKPGGHQDSAYLVQIMTEQKITTLHFVPAMLQVFIQEQGLEDCTSLKRVICSGEALPFELQAQFFARLPAVALHNLYGPTEAAVDVTYWQCQPESFLNQVPIGKPIANTQIYILDNYQKQVPIGVPGELHIGGAGLARGYLNRPDLTKEKFIPNPFSNVPKDRLYKTGDLACYLPDGNIEYLGRIDNQVKIRGFRIELGEIETVLAQHQAVQENVVVVHEVSKKDKRLVACIVPKLGQPIENAELRRFLLEPLPDYMIPSAFVTLKSLPLTPNGKIDRKALVGWVERSETHQLRLSEKTWVAPRTPEEELLAGIWSKVLGIESIGIHDNFFELGGHSLLATQVMSRIRDTFACELPLSAFFESPTIADFSELLQTARHQEPLPPISSANREQPLPLSFAQQRLWFLNQLEGPSATYNIPMALSLEGTLNHAALERTLQILVERHESLRTVFDTPNGEPQLSVTRPQLSVINLQILSLEEQELEVQRLLNEEAQRPFNLSTGPLFRTLLLQGDKIQVLFVNMHHIISDGWSMGVLIRELSSLYEAFSQNQPSPLPPLPIQYVDFANWQRQWLTGKVVEKQLSHWKKQLANAPSLLELPTDYSRPPVQQFRGATYPLQISAELSKQLKSLSQKTGTTLFMTLFSAFGILLSRYSGQSDLIIGSPIANRTHSQTESLIGFFVNTLVLRLNLSGNPFFESVLQQARRVALEAYAHQDIPFEQLVEELQPQRSLSHSPLFQVMFALQNAPLEPLELSGLTLTPIEIPSVVAKFDLTLSLEETTSGLSGVLEYSTDLFKQATIARLVGHFQTLLVGIVANPLESIHQLPLLTQAEQAQFQAWNDTTTDYPQDKCIHQLFEAQVEQRADGIAVIFENQQITYSELNAKANQVAHYLQSVGVKPEVLVGICIERSIEMVIGLLAIIKAGGAYLPLEPSYPVARLALMLENANISILLSQSSLADKLPKLKVPVIFLDKEEHQFSQLNSDNLVTDVSPFNLAYVIYTSGSTGQAKGVMVEHHNVLGMLHGFEQIAPCSGSLIGTSVCPFSFDVSVWEFFSNLCFGGTLHIIEREILLNSEHFVHYLTEHRIKSTYIPPALLVEVASQLEKQNCPPTLNRLLVGVEPIEQGILQRFRHLSKQMHIVNGYGPTETTICATFFNFINAFDSKQRTPIGCAVSGYEIYLTDSHLQLVPIGVMGEILIGGVGIARGYLNKLKLTNEKFIQNPFSDDPNARLYKTGDLARYLPDGNLEYLGRIDNQVKLRGFRIELGEIEAVLSEDDAIKETIVILHESDGNKSLAAYLTLHQPIELLLLRDYLKTRLPDYMIPASFTVLEKLPLTPNGKIDRKALPEPALVLSNDHYEPPRTGTEQQLANIWSAVLKRPDIGIHDNFFDLGGDSILSIQIVARARQVDLALSPRDIFQHQTLAELAQVVQPIGEGLAEQGLVQGEVALTPIQSWFFARDNSEPWYFNQAMLLEVPAQFNETAVRQALSALLHHHDALRLRYRQVDGIWQQYHSAPDSEVPLSIETLADNDFAKALNERASHWQASLNLENGPLTRLVLFQHEQGIRLLWIIHHLAVDGVSWRILLEDLNTAYRQANAGQAIQLPAKTSSFQAWSEHLHQWADHTDFAVDAAYWRQQPVLKAQLPVDYPQGRNWVINTCHHRLTLNSETTRRLLEEAPSAYRTGINDLLLSALLLTLHEWNGQRQHAIDLESHGRSNLFNDIDLSRTVGWFTALYSVVLSLPDSDDLGQVIKNVKEQLRQIPNDGIGYGLLRQQGEALPQGEILFNYLGQFDQISEDSHDSFGLAQEGTGNSHSLTGSRAHLIDINGLTVHGKLSLTFSYSSKQYKAETIQDLADTYQKYLQNLIEHCQNHYGYTPSDFPLTQLSQSQLDTLTKLYQNNIAAIYPLTPMQQGMLFHSLYEPDSNLYFIQLHCQLSGDIQPDFMRQAWQYLIDRHPILRTAFRYDQDNPVQIVFKQAYLPWMEADWQKLSKTEYQQQWETLLEQTHQRGFDFTQAPLMRLQLIRKNINSYELIWYHHHILMDGWCLPIIFSELFTVYSALRHQQTPQLPPVSRYQNYIAWLVQQDQQAAQSYWQEKLAGFTTPTLIPIASHSQQAARYQEINQTLTLEETQHLNQFARQQRVTLNTLVQTAWAILLSRYTGETDIVFGAVTSGRNVPLHGIEKMIGLFINTLPLRVNLNTDVLTLLHDLQAQQQEDNRYAYTSLADIQSWSEVPNGVALFDSILVFENYPVDDALKTQQDLPFQIEVIQSIIQTNYLFTLTVLPGKSLSFKLRFDCNLVEPQAGEVIVEQLMGLLRQFVTQPPASLDDYTLLTPKAITCLADPSQALPMPDYPLVTSQLIHQANTRPDTIAIRYGQFEWSYHTLYQSACDIARTLLEAGLQTGDTVALYGKRSPEMVAGIIGVFLSGGVCLPVDAQLPLERRLVMLHTAKARYGMGIDHEPAWMQEHCQIVMPRKDVPEIPLLSLQPQQPAYIFFTSGTSGTPKAIMGSHRGLAHFIHWQTKTFQVGQQDNLAHLIGLSFDAVLRDIWLPLTNGATLVIPEPTILTDGLSLFKWLAEYHITLWHSVPSLLESWLMALSKPYALPDLRYLFLAGEPLTEQLIEHWQTQLKSPAQLINLYGSTETTLIKSFYPIIEPQPGIQALGQALPDTQILVLKQQKYCGLYEPGEIVIRTPFRTLGYLNAEKPAFVPNPFRNDPDDLLYYTGDTGYYDINGLLHSLGRRDLQVKVRGVRIELEEISSLLNQHPNVRQSVVVAKGEAHHRYLVAFVHQDTSLSEAELRNHLLERLPDYMMPSRFIWLDTLPLTPSGKIDRKALPEPEALSEKTFVAPRDAFERQLAQIWENLLKVHPIGVHDNFFELGGHSLLAVRLMAEIGQQFNRHLPLTALFQGTTIEHLATLLRQQTDFQSWAPLVAIQPKGCKRPFFCVPGAGGEVTYFYELAHQLGQDQPFYGLQAVGLDGKTKPYTRVEDMAARYIKEIQTVQPQGPYQLGGHSFGGRIAFEMALQLQAQRHEVSHLIMLDAVAPYPINDPNISERLWHAQVAGLIEYLLGIPFADTDKLLKTLELDALLAYLQEKLTQTHWLPPEASITQIRGMVEVLKTNFQISYIPKNRVSTQITLIQAQEMPIAAKEMLEELQILNFYQEPTYGWGQFATNVDVHQIPGTHISILTPPHVQLLAEKLKKCLWS